MKTMSIQEIKQRIDGYHCLVSISQLSEGDCGDAIGDLLRGLDLTQSELDDIYNHKWESYCRHGLYQPEEEQQ